MKAVRISIISIQFLLLISCSSKRELKFQGTDYAYKLSIPFEHKIAKWQNHNAELMEKFGEARMNDGSVIYVTNDIKGGGGVEDYKTEKYGTYSLSHYILNDTSTIHGSHNGKFWKEIKYYNIVVGYYDVSGDRKTKYDEIISTIIPQVENARQLIK
ncbi:hypothetical protein ACFQZS_02625 [Mucilaginibacter calamicampi]|uniref:Gliding motility-associated lipoprotein GldD n=1 Tax=Mucilaginibacter calamicampi TaxID=1302352 RepID=A0ABW2YTW2_9SPHI